MSKQHPRIKPPRTKEEREWLREEINRRKRKQLGLGQAGKAAGKTQSFVGMCFEAAERDPLLALDLAIRRLEGGRVV